MMATLKIAIISILVALSFNVSRGEDKPYPCGENFTQLDKDQGTLSITRSSKSCGFIAKENGTYMEIQIDSLDFSAGDKLTISPLDTASKPVDIEGPQDDGFIVLGKRSELIFTFNSTSKNDREILLRFNQDPTKPIMIAGDKRKELSIRPVEIKDINLSIQKSTLVYVEVIGTSNFGHHLITKDGSPLLLNPISNSLITVKLSAAYEKCSNNRITNTEDSWDISGPENEILEYKCVNIFETKNGGHFNVDFKNFIEMASSADELRISDGSQILTITDSNSKDYKELISSIIFKGQKLAVVYSSPPKNSRITVPFKLTVHSKLSGGVVDTFDYKFIIPPKGSALYSLKAPEKSSGSVNLEFVGFSGASVTIYNRQNKKIQLSTIKSLSSTISFNNPDNDISVEFLSDGKTKISGSVNYKPSNDCGGTLFESSGIISIKGSNKTCHWFMGAQSNVVNVNFNDLQSGGFLEIYSLQQATPIFSRKDVAPVEVLPPIMLNSPALLKIQLGSQGFFDASISSITKTQVSSTLGSQTSITSVGYPTFYPWSDESEKFSVGEKDKEVILSIADLDLRDSEKVSVNSVSVVKDQVPFDFPLKNQVDVTIQRSASKDFSFHRGYKMITTEFQKIFIADMNKNIVTTSKNLTSLLVKIPGEAGKRISYDITYSNANTDHMIQLIDSSSLLGRSVESEQMVKGSTTSNVLLLSLRSTKDKVYLPEVTVNYDQLACNKSTDHTCDGSARCVPADKMCKGISYCADGSDLKVPCSSGPAPQPKVIEKGVSGMTVFVLCLLMLTIGALSALYGPDLYKGFQTRYRSGHYTTFQSAE